MGRRGRDRSPGSKSVTERTRLDPDKAPNTPGVFPMTNPIMLNLFVETLVTIRIYYRTNGVRCQW